MKNLRLKGKIVEKFGSQTDFATVLKLKESYVSYIVRGRRKLDPGSQAEWASRLGCKVSDIFEQE